MLDSGATVHTYNNRGRMKTARLSSTSVTTSYLYNALGQRVRKSGGAAGTIFFVYDEAGHLVGEYSGSGALIQETVWLGDIPVATLRSISGVMTVFYVHTDQLNTPRKVTNTANTVRWKWDPTPFGEGVPGEPAGAFTYNLRFPGQYFDVETNLNYNYYRDYDPAVGRYLESDPIGLDGGINLFSYVGGSPLARADLRGLEYGAVYAAEYRQLVKYGPGIHIGPPVLGSELQALLCKFIRQHKGNFDSVFTDLNNARRGYVPQGLPPNPDTWNDPLLRNAENFAAAAAPHSGIDYGGMGHNYVGITAYQFILKPIIYPVVGKRTTPFSISAWSAGIDGSWWYGRNDTAARALKWCGECGE